MSIDFLRKPSPDWERGRFDEDHQAEIRDKLQHTSFLQQALSELGQGLDSGASRTVFRLPINLEGVRPDAAILNTARESAQIIMAEEMGNNRGFVVSENISPEEFEMVELPPGIKGGFDPQAPVGYIRTERTPEGTLQNSAGCINPSNRRHYSIVF